MKVSTRSVGGRSESSHRPGDIAGILAFALAAVIVVALATRNSGVLGQSLSALFLVLFGKGAWVVPVLLCALGVAMLRGRSLAIRHLAIGLGLLFVTLLGFLAASVRGEFFDPAIVSASGGYFGAFVSWLLATLLGAARPVGLAAIGLVGIVLCLDVPLRAALPIARLRSKPMLTGRVGVRGQNEQPQEPTRPVRRNFVGAGIRAMEAEGATQHPETRERTREVDRAPRIDADVPVPKEGYQLPPNNLLAEAVLQPKRSQTEMQRNIETLEGTLEQFGIDANVVEVATGPTVTRYEIQLGPGIRVSRITALADNIAMELAASQVRVEAPIPGKAAIGVEVPNAAPSTVTLRELCDDNHFRNAASRLYVALGKDVSGANKYADLSKMPHLLIGGATNSGKSIGLATLITSLLMRNTPKDVRFVMVDPKRVELTLFDQIPHLMCPVIKEVKEAAGVLRAVWREMDRRYEKFSEAGVRNIDGWNGKASFAEKLPYIVLVVDELADLMIQCGAEVEAVIVRLAQLARAVGIHMILATQRPSVDVITGLIKANIPSRIAFSTASYIDSRTIIDIKGAEALIGRGDMLFKPIDAIKPVRIQGCYVGEKEIEAICRFWRAQQRVEYVLAPIDEAVQNRDREAGESAEEADPLWEDAVRWAVDRGQASTSMLQRKFSIGFQRASRLLDSMEERGIVGPRDGPRPREVLVSPLDVESLFGGKGPGAAYSPE